MVQTAPQRSSTNHHQNLRDRQIAALLVLLHNRDYLRLKVRVSQFSVTNH
jgi:hypothetical protein